MRVSAAVFATLLSGQAAALSCMPPDPRATFLSLMEVEQPYYILYGRLQFDTSLLPSFVEEGTPEPAAIAARFSGKGLTATGFDADFIRDVTLQPVCFGPWCGGAPADVATLYFAKVNGDVVTIEADPCGGTVFPEPSDEMLDAMTACISGGPCTAPEPL